MPIGKISDVTSVTPAPGSDFATGAKQDIGNASAASLDGKFPAAAAPSDGSSNATISTETTVRNTVFNGTAWDRLRGSLSGVTSAVLSSWTGVLHTLPFGRYSASRPTLTDGQGTYSMFNQRGDLSIQEQYSPDYEDNANDVAWVATRSLATAVGAWSNYQSGTTKVGTAGLSVKTSGGRVRRMGAGSASATGAFLVAVNKASAAANGDAVIASVWIPAGQANNIDLGESGVYFDTGISLAMSSTPEKVTLVAAEFHLWAQWL